MNTFVVGYIIVWASVVLYIGSMARRQRRLMQQYEELRERIERRGDEDVSARRAA